MSTSAASILRQWRAHPGPNQLPLDFDVEYAELVRAGGAAPSTSRARRHGSSYSEAMTSVGQFHFAFGLPTSARPTTDIPTWLATLRSDLLAEECAEFAEASALGDVVAIADALADIVYVAYGSALTYGIDLDAVVREVHRSNMSKLDSNGQPIYRADGKVLKSDQYFRPDLVSVLLDQPTLTL